MASQSVTLRVIKKTRSDQRLFFAQSEFGDDINFTIQDANGNARDLTGITPAFQVWSKKVEPRSAPPTVQWTAGSATTPFIDQDCVIVNAPAGQCKYTVQTSDFAYRVGTFYARILLKTGTTKKESTETFLVVVQE